MTVEKGLSLGEALASTGDRNARISNCMLLGNKPVLPFEISAKEQELRSLAAKQACLGVSLGEAMRQSSETWHDNAPADAVNSDSKVIVGQAGVVQEAIRNAVEFGYPSDIEKQVTLGSLVEIIYDGDDEPEYVYITGVTTKLDDVNEFSGMQLPQHVGVFTLLAPLGNSLLGATEGDELTYTVENKGRVITNQLTVLSIIQKNPLNP